MHVPDQARQAEDMTALGHSRSGGCTQADRASRRLRLSRNKNLQNIIPVNVNIGVDALGAIVGSGIYNETIVCVNVSK